MFSQRARTREVRQAAELRHGLRFRLLCPTSGSDSFRLCCRQAKPEVTQFPITVVKRQYTGQSPKYIGLRITADGSILFFVRVEYFRRVKALHRSELSSQDNGQRRAFTPAVILFIALPEP